MKPLPLLLTVAVCAAPLLAQGGERVLQVRASAAVAPCVEEAAGRWPGGVRVIVERGALGQAKGTDLFAGSAVEMTRAVETGAAREGSEVDLARIPWVLSLPAGNPDRVTGLADLGRTGQDVALLAGPEAYEARRALVGALRGERIHEFGDRKGLDAAGLALVPLSLSRGQTLAVDVPPLIARAAFAEGAPHAALARTFLQYLGSEEGRRAFAECGTTSR